MPRMLVEVLVLGGEEGVDDELRHRLDRQIEPALVGVFGEQRAVGRVHPRHHRRLIILKLRIIRQVLGIMPQKAGDGGDRRRRTGWFPPRTESPRNRSRIFIENVPPGIRPPRRPLGSRPARRRTCRVTLHLAANPPEAPPMHRVSSLGFLFKLRPFGRAYGRVSGRPAVSSRRRGRRPHGSRSSLYRLRDRFRASGCARCRTRAIAGPAWLET